MLSPTALPPITPLTADEPEAMSADPVAANVQVLKALFPDAFSEDGVDFGALRQLLGDAVDDGEEKFGLNWSGKRRARRLALTPSLGTLLPAREDSVDWDTTKNLMIEGDNLEVLKLLQKSYAGKIKLIYIDPPYNTGGDFVYPDDYSDSLGNYLRRTGQVDGDNIKNTSNTESNGRFHTDWLNMIYPRLSLAQKLLKPSGCIAVSIGDDEIANLSLVCDEIFGSENFVTICSRVAKTGGQKGVHFSPSVDYILIYAKNIQELGPFREPISENVINKVYTRVQPDGPKAGKKFRSMGLYQAMLDSRANQRYYIKCPDGQFVIPPGKSFPNSVESGAQVKPGDGDGVWRWTFKRFAEELEAGNIEFVRSDRTSLVKPDGAAASWNIYYKIWLDDRLEDGQLPGNIIEKFQSRHASSELKALDIPFDFAKPSALVKYLLEITGVEDQEIVLDFFAGSGTTAHAALEISAESGKSRRFILVQLPEKTQPESDESKRGFATISEIAAERVRRVSKALKGKFSYEVDLGFRAYKLATSNLKAWSPGSDLEADLLSAADNLAPGRTEDDLLVELLLKRGIDLVEPSQTREIAGRMVHAFGGGVMLACLGDVHVADAEALADGMADWVERLAPVAPAMIFFKDAGFENDVAKTNVAKILDQRLNGRAPGEAHLLESVRSV